MAQVDPRLERDIGAAEADKLVAYRDSLGNWTACRGHLLEPQDHDWAGATFTPAQDEVFFQADIQEAIAFVQRLPEWPSLDTVCRQNAVIELGFNMHSKWLGFHLCRAAIQAQQWQVAHDQLLNSAWATEVHATRANRIAGYLLTGEYPA